MDYLAQSNLNTSMAQKIISDSCIISLWQSVGARINLVGSLRIGVLAKHLDIDFHVYTPELDVSQSFIVISQIAQNPAVKKIEFINLAQTDECCFEWHIWYEDDDRNLWQIDIIQIKSGSFYDGYFERVADTIKDAMTADMKQTILKLKFDTPDYLKISGMEYYKAVIQDGITNFEDFLAWRAEHSFNGIIEW